MENELDKRDLVFEDNDGENTNRKNNFRETGVFRDKDTTESAITT